MIKAGELMHTAVFYASKYINNGNGTRSERLTEIRKVKCSVNDVTYKDIEAGRRENLESTLKIRTYYFKEFESKTLKVKIDNREEIYEVVYRENVKLINRELIFTLKAIKK